MTFYGLAIKQTGELMKQRSGLDPNQHAEREKRLEEGLQIHHSMVGSLEKPLSIPSTHDEMSDTLLITMLNHGDESDVVYAAYQCLLRRIAQNKRQVNVVVLLCNLDALYQDCRGINIDFNRYWDPHTPPDAALPEAERMGFIQDVLQGIFVNSKRVVHLDLHQTINATLGPFALAYATNEAQQVATAMRIERLLTNPIRTALVKGKQISTERTASMGSYASVTLEVSQIGDFQRASTTTTIAIEGLLEWMDNECPDLDISGVKPLRLVGHMVWNPLARLSDKSLINGTYVSKGDSIGELTRPDGSVDILRANATGYLYFGKKPDSVPEPVRLIQIFGE